MHQYYSLGLIFQWCNKFEPTWMLLSKQINEFFQINVYYTVDVHINSQRGEPLLCREYYLVLATENS